MSETSEKIIDKIIDNATSRLRIPIVSTYIIVLIFHNWDLVYYLLFQTGEATTKIAYIKKNYPNYWDGIFDALFFAIIILVVFTVIDTSLTYGFRNFYKFKKKMIDEVNEYKTIDEFKALISTLTEENLKLKEKNQQELDHNSQHLSVITKLSSDLNTLENNINNDIDIVRFGNFMSQLIKIDNEFNLQALKMILLNLNNRLKDKNVVLFSEIFRNHELTNGPNGIKPIREIVFLLVDYKYLNMKEIKIGSYELSYNKNIDFIYSLYNIKTTPN